MKNILSQLALLVFLALLSSCSHDIFCSAGVPSLSDNSVKSVIEKCEANPPTTEREMVELLQHEPLGVCHDAKGKYSHWGYVAVTPTGERYQSVAGCLSVKGKIVAYCIRRPSFWSGETICGDVSIFKAENNPGMATAALPFFRKIQECRAAQIGRPVYFSESGKTSYILPLGEKFLGWNGEEPQVEKLYDQTPVAQSNASPGLGTIFLNAFITALANTPTTTYVPQPTVTGTPAPSNNNQRIIDYWNRKAAKAKQDGERYRDMHWGSKGGFSTF